LSFKDDNLRSFKNLCKLVTTQSTNLAQTF